MRRIALLCVLTALVLGAAAPGASATTFSGSCDMTGTIIPLKPYTFVIENNDAEVFGQGTCTGALDGRPYNGPAHIYVDGRMDSPMSCGFLLARGVPGVITFGDDPKAVDATYLDLDIPEGFEVAGQMFGHVNGAYNGEGLMRLQLDATQEEFEACASEGLSSVDFVLELETVKELYG
jgi:hypothetical protein